jgi:hypothetical protein
LAPVHSLDKPEPERAGLSGKLQNPNYNTKKGEQIRAGACKSANFRKAVRKQKNKIELHLPTLKP